MDNICSVYGKSMENLWTLDMGDVPSGKLTQLLKMAIEIASFPIENGEFPKLC